MVPAVAAARTVYNFTAHEQPRRIMKRSSAAVAAGASFASPRKRPSAAEAATAQVSAQSSSVHNGGTSAGTSPDSDSVLHAFAGTLARALFAAVDAGASALERDDRFWPTRASRYSVVWRLVSVGTDQWCVAARGPPLSLFRSRCVLSSPA